MLRFCKWFNKVILRVNNKACNKKHPHYKHIRCQRVKDHSGHHVSRKPHGLTHLSYFAWSDNGKYSGPILKRKS